MEARSVVLPFPSFFLHLLTFGSSQLTSPPLTANKTLTQSTKTHTFKCIEIPNTRASCPHILPCLLLSMGRCLCRAMCWCLIFSKWHSPDMPRKWHPHPGSWPRWRKWKICSVPGDCQLHPDPAPSRPPISTRLPLGKCQPTGCYDNWHRSWGTEIDHQES